MNIGWDTGNVFATNVLPPENEIEETRKTREEKLFNFIQEFRLENQFIYR